MKYASLLSAAFGFVGVFAAGSAWASHILEPTYKSWIWILMASFIMAVVTGVLMMPELAFSSLFLVIFSYAGGLGLGAGAFIGYVRLVDAQKWNAAQAAASLPYKAPVKEIRRRERLQALSFESKDGGLRFSYVSESRSGQPVSVTNEQDIVRLTLGRDENGGALKLFKKSSDKSLIDLLNKLYPAYRFFEYNFSGQAKEKFERYHFPKGYSVVIPRDDGPMIGIEIPSKRIGRCFVMDTAHPDKYIYLVLPEYPVEAVKPTEEKPFPLSWYDSIRFL